MNETGAGSGEDGRISTNSGSCCYLSRKKRGLSTRYANAIKQENAYNCSNRGLHDN